MNKHPKEIAAFFGVITAGNFYVPIDEEMPASRIQMILENVQAQVLICDSQTREIADKFDYEGKVVLYDEICETAVNDEALQDIRSRAIDTDPIYIVFTSGSTGCPRGWRPATAPSSTISSSCRRCWSLTGIRCLATRRRCILTPA